MSECQKAITLTDRWEASNVSHEQLHTWLNGFLSIATTAEAHGYCSMNVCINVQPWENISWETIRKFQMTIITNPSWLRSLLKENVQILWTSDSSHGSSLLAENKGESLHKLPNVHKEVTLHHWGHTAPQRGWHWAANVVNASQIIS